MKNVLGVAVLAGLLIFGAACGNKGPDKVTVTADAAMDAQTLADSGEQLVTPYTFMLADKVFDMALSKDPSNMKAQFYKAFLKAPMTLKGAIKRIRPAVLKYGDIKKFDTWQLQIPNSPAKNFLNDGQEDIANENDLQNLLVQYRNATADFRKFLKANPDLDLVLYMNPFVFQNEILKDASQYCVVNTNNSTTVDVTCDYREILQRKINSADVVALSQLAAGETLYLTLYTTYTLEGIADLQVVDPHGKMPLPQVQQFLEGRSGFGKLRADNNLKSFLDYGADASAAWKYALQNQAQLCPPTKYPFEKKRKGYVFDNGFCTTAVDTDLQKLAGLLDQAIAGPITQDLKMPNGTNRATLIDVFAPARRPITDLRLVSPMAYSACGKPTAFKDNTFSGFLPNGDINFFIDASCTK